MSGQCTIWAWQQADRCESASHFLVLLKLADMAHDDGKVWPSHAYLAAKTKLSERTVRSAITAMDGVLLTTTPRPGKTDIIWLCLTTVVVHPTSRGEMEMEAGPRGRPQKTPANPAITPATDDITPAPVADEPSKEPSNRTIGTSNEVLVVRADDVQIAFDAYNLMAGATGLAKARDLTPSRRKALKARLATVKPRGWSEALEAVMNTPFLLGQNDKGWKADLDFLLQPKSLQRVLEGSYKGLANVRPTVSADAGFERDQSRQGRRDAGLVEALNRRKDRWNIRGASDWAQPDSAG